VALSDWIFLVKSTIEFNPCFFDDVVEQRFAGKVHKVNGLIQVFDQFGVKFEKEPLVDASDRKVYVLGFSADLGR
jgi:hypothetical protein